MESKAMQRSLRGKTIQRHKTKNEKKAMSNKAELSTIEKRYDELVKVCPKAAEEDGLWFAAKSSIESGVEAAYPNFCWFDFKALRAPWVRSDIRLEAFATALE